MLNSGRYDDLIYYANYSKSVVEIKQFKQISSNYIFDEYFCLYQKVC